MATLTIKPTAAGNDVQIKSGDGNTIHATFGDTSSISGTISTGSIASAVTFPAGHVIQMNSTTDGTLVTRTGDLTSYAATGITCVLANDLQSSSKLFAQFSTQCGENAGSWWAGANVFAIYNNSTNVGEARGLGSASHTHADSQTYSNRNVSGSILFTPTGSGATERTISLYWKYSVSQSHTSYLNRADNANVAYNTGSTTLTLMEIAQ